jgi:capsular polysaccharide biosynthesis protein
MELRDYVRIWGRHITLIVIIAIIGATSAYFFAKRQPIQFEGTTTFTVTKPSQPASNNFYEYDQFYAVQASTIFADTIASWLQDPNTVAEIYDAAKVEVPAGGTTKISKVFRVRKQPQTTTLYLTVRNTDQDKVNGVVGSAQTVVESKLSDLRSQSKDPNYFQVATTTPRVFAIEPKPYLSGLFGLVSGLILGLLTAWLLEYLREK